MSGEVARDTRRRSGHPFDGLGPGLVTGAADDDPSGIATYSAAGARFGYGMLWTSILSLPLMIGVQLMSARLALVSGRGFAAVLREWYPRPVLWGACSLLLIANTINIGADLAAMAEALTLVTGAPAWSFLAPVAVSILLVLAFSPYLFFWQAAQEVEEEEALGRTSPAARAGATDGELAAARRDVTSGMLLSNAIFFFITLTCGATLHPAGITEVRTAADAAAALRPLAGDGASLLFAAGLIGTGLLAVPVLAGSSAYAIAEMRNWREGMNERPTTAPGFYGVIAAGLCGGLVVATMELDAMRLLFFAAVINGLLATPLLAMLLVACNDRRVMGARVNGPLLNLLGGAAVLAMAAAAAALLW